MMLAYEASALAKTIRSSAKRKVRQRGALFRDFDAIEVSKHLLPRNQPGEDLSAEDKMKGGKGISLPEATGRIELPKGRAIEQ